MKEGIRTKKPKWLRVKLPTGENYKKVRSLVDEHNLHTICESGNCPNMGECWARGVATIMILGDICTRSCRFCDVATGRPLPVDEGDWRLVAAASPSTRPAALLRGPSPPAHAPSAASIVHPGAMP